jgi:hypothetical protein
MQVTRYSDVSEFLQIMQPLYEQDEVANGLKLGICLRLQQDPNAYKAAPYLAMVEAERGLALAAQMTPPHNLLLYSPERPRGSLRPARSEAEAFDALAADLITGGWPVPGVMGRPELTDGFARAYAAQTGKRYRLGMSHRIYRLTHVSLPQGVPGWLRQARPEEAPLIAQWLEAFQVEANAPMSAQPQEWAEERIAQGHVYVWDDGAERLCRPASMAARTRRTAHGATVSAVYTPPEFRRRGYASACVAGLSQLLLDAGFQFCTLYTDLANPISNHIYQEIGYRPVCDTNEMIFSD